MSEERPRRTSFYVGIGCLALALFCCCTLFLGGALVYLAGRSAMQESPQVELEVVPPPAPVEVGEAFSLQVTVANRTSARQSLQVMLLPTEGMALEVMEIQSPPLWGPISIGGVTTVLFEDIAIEEERIITLTLRAQGRGTHLLLLRANLGLSHGRTEEVKIEVR